MTNEELIQKAVITATNNLATDGKLNDAQADKFLDYIIDESVLKGNARIVRFRNENMNIDKIGLGKRAAMPADEAIDPGHRRGVTHTKVKLTPKEIIVPVEISKIYKEINVEGESVEDHLMRMFAAQTSNDAEELGLNGNALGPAIIEADYFDGAGSTSQYIADKFLKLTDGYIEKAESANIVDNAGANIGLSTFGKAIRALPTKFRRNTNNLRFYMSSDLYSLYAEKMSTRADSAGTDAAKGNPLAPFGIKIVPVPLMTLQPPITEHIVLTGTDTISLANKPVTDVVVLPSTLDVTPTTPYTEGSGNDYVLNATNGTITRDAAGTISAGATVKVTYNAYPQLMLTHMNNFIWAIGRDIELDTDKDIFKRVKQFVITAKVDYNFEELTALVKVRNIGMGI